MDATALQAWMAEHEYSIYELGPALGYSPRSITRWRAGEWPIPRSVELALDALAAERAPKNK